MPQEEIVNLALRRSIFYPSADIYPNAPSGFWDFGPVGESLRRKIIELWRKELVQKENMLEIYGAQIMPEAVFKASGHLENFDDPIVQCLKCHSHFRADKLIEEKTKESLPESMADEKFTELIEKNNIKCTKCKGVLGKVKRFNMMMKTEIGATGQNPCYLRPETCQSIFLDFSRLYKTMRLNLPFGIAQAGTSFRNEISPRQSLIREREIGQFEAEIFFNPDKINEVENFDDVENYKINLMLIGKKMNPISCKDAVSKKIVSGKLVAYYITRVQQLFEKYGIPVKAMRFRELAKEARAFYAKETWDFEVETDLGWIELMACNYRTDYDLKSHSKESKKDLSVNEDGKKFIPHVFELSAGIDRTLYVVLDHGFRKEKRGPEERTYLKLPARVAPFFVAVFPLVKKDGLKEKAESLYKELSDFEFDAFFDDKGSIGKRYARADEIGTPYAITLDYDTLEKGTVTLRERDSMEQKRIKIQELPETLWKLKIGKAEYKTL
ncbi:MAG: glycine--tRNA ligase [Candidatus Diapherotrites archaeon]